jgi:hypothetical protein
MGSNRRTGLGRRMVNIGTGLGRRVISPCQTAGEIPIALARAVEKQRC